MKRAALLAVGFVLLAARPASAGPLIDEPDAVELANGLADATAEQGICYGWKVDINDRGTFLVDVGSNLGPTVPVALEAGCDKWVELHVRYTWTSETSEAEDSVDYSVESNLAGAPNTVDLRRVGFGDGTFLRDEDVAVINASLALPTLVAESGLAPEVRLEENTGTIPAADRPTPVGDSDLMRQYGWAFATFGLLLFGAVVWLVYELVLRRMGFRWGD